jgi:hypothetical protein
MKLGDALIQWSHGDVITLKGDLPSTQPPGQLVGKVFALS